MPSVKQRKGPVSGGKDEVYKSDEDILKARRALEAFDSADTYLGVVGLCLWALSFVWFAYYSDHTQVATSLHHGASEPSVLLLVGGCFCRGLSKASPRAWSTWRLGFHLAWCPVFVMLALAAVSSGSTKVSSQITYSVALASGLLAAGAVLTFPGATAASGKSANSAMGRTLLLLDGVAMLALAASMIVGTEWSGLGPVTTALAALPLIPVGVAICLSGTDAEMVNAAPSMMMFYVGAIMRSVYLSGPIGAVPFAALFVAHAALYLPMGSDPESNPFHMARMRAWKGFTGMMSAPGGAGFADE